MLIRIPKIRVYILSMLCIGRFLKSGASKKFHICMRGKVFSNTDNYNLHQYFCCKCLCGKKFGNRERRNAHFKCKNCSGTSCTVCNCDFVAKDTKNFAYQKKSSNLFPP